MKEIILHISKNLSASKEIVKQFPLAIQKKLPAEIGIISISAAESQKLNRCYRKKDKPTNVLSFFYDKNYGEILVCPAVIRKEAQEHGHTYQHQMTWMIVHGMIHLSRIHHEKSSVVAKRVAALEKSIMDKFI